MLATVNCLLNCKVLFWLPLLVNVWQLSLAYLIVRCFFLLALLVNVWQLSLNYVLLTSL